MVISVAAIPARVSPRCEVLGPRAADPDATGYGTAVGRGSCERAIRHCVVARCRGTHRLGTARAGHRRGASAARGWVSTYAGRRRSKVRRKHAGHTVHPLLGVTFRKCTAVIDTNGDGRVPGKPSGRDRSRGPVVVRLGNPDPILPAQQFNRSVFPAVNPSGPPPGGLFSWSVLWQSDPFRPKASRRASKAIFVTRSPPWARCCRGKTLISPPIGMRR